ncbi:MAG: hypothetical protein IT285_08050 [Bdellovibrionales bacterium]|nr:hypothetical protein [Bdellovibrionales bacterium]
MTGFGRSLSPLAACAGLIAACAGLIAACALGACARQDPPLGVRGGELESCEGRSACESGAVPLGRDPGQAAARIVEPLM